MKLWTVVLISNKKFHTQFFWHSEIEDTLEQISKSTHKVDSESGLKAEKSIITNTNTIYVIIIDEIMNSSFNFQQKISHSIFLAFRNRGYFGTDFEKHT